MPRITEELVRKRSEHNEMEIGSLEELSLHQEDIEKLEHLQNWCRDLKILLLHHNLISKIENLGKLKQLEYINFSLNNIERIENLEGCESLEKLDFTLNFIGELTSVESLKSNTHLQILFLTGNPCTDFKGYRQYVTATLPNLKTLDGVEITWSERIQALQKYDEVKLQILDEQKKYKDKREKEKQRNKPKLEEVVNEKPMTEEETKAFWEEMTDNSPETRVEIARKSRRCRGGEERDPNVDPLKPPKRIIKFFDDNGRPRCINEAKIDFQIQEDEETNSYILDLAVYRYLDTNYLEVDVQPTYVRVMVKGKAFQIVLSDEVLPDRSKAERSQTTGHLQVTMPKVKGEIKPRDRDEFKPALMTKVKQPERVNYLELGDGRGKEVDYWNILENGKGKEEEDFQDDPNVPPLLEDSSIFK